LLFGLCIPVQMVAPTKWKKAMMYGMGKEKDASRLAALRLYPKAELHLCKHHGRADAILMARWLWEKHDGGKR
jgi:crossover junction endodeoxyribonuclease RuvC